jgi:two-component system sensor histidine kinase KdpD
MRVLAAVVIVGIATVVLVAADADLTFASIVLLLAVAGDAVLGYAAGLAAALSSTVLLTYYFTPPVHSFRIDQPDDILALVAFVAVSLLVGATIARLNELRERAEVNAREASLRVRLVQELRRGAPVQSTLLHLASELDDLYDLSECVVLVAPEQAEPDAATDVVISTPPLSLRLAPRQALRPEEVESITGVAAAVATMLELERLDMEAREERLRHELDRSRAGFLTAMTHDLRTPLATIKAASGALLARESPLDAGERRELLEDTYSEAARLERLVNKVLEIARIRSGGVVIEPVAIAAADVVHVAVAHLGALLGDRVVNLDFDDELPAVEVDALLLEHVFVNLLENAVVHDPSGDQIDIRGTQSGAALRVAVIDHGPGVPECDRERIFDEFARRRAASDGPGTGLGLAIVRALVGANAGRVWCEATPGGGATFVVELPIVDDQEAR